MQLNTAILYWALTYYTRTKEYFFDDDQLSFFAKSKCENNQDGGIPINH